MIREGCWWQCPFRMFWVINLPVPSARSATMSTRMNIWHAFSLLSSFGENFHELWVHRSISIGCACCQCTDMHQMLTQKKSTNQLPPGHQATLQIGSTWVTSYLPTAIKEAVYRPAMVEYIMARAWWEVKDVCNMVDWEVQPWAGSKIKGEQHTTIFKLEFDFFLMVKKRRKYEKFSDAWRCPQCRKFNEDFDHILRCPHTIQAWAQTWMHMMEPFNDH